ncbi:MAG: GMC oxidoreductase [Alphaproteobacteria bacterium]|nr:GMC oxidoreductase [Alphaproteobacteria bacterium]MDD9919829.1 GMC oxidoreductase [Alphaproteobacteria bacterium]
MVSSSVVIIGAGMAGSVLAHKLAGTFNVTVVELSQKGGDFPIEIEELGQPAITDPIAMAGPGGTTQAWHNGLIEITPEHFENWPFGQEELAQYYPEAYTILGGMTREQVEASAERMREKMVAAGVPEEALGTSLCYPVDRRNIWQHLCGKDKCIQQIFGRVTAFDVQNQQIKAITVETDGGSVRVEADMFIVSSGGLGTPCILQQLSTKEDSKGVALAGYHYEDHPFAFVGEAQLTGALYKLWNWKIPKEKATIRLPFISHMEDGTPVSFYLRPAAMWWRMQKRASLTSVLNELRNHPWRITAYFKLLKSWDDVLDILSFKFGIRVPTDRYSLLMVAAQPPQRHQAIHLGEKGQIVRDWRLDKDYLAALNVAIDGLIEKLGGLVKDFHKYPGWEERLQSSSHHSGTARLAKDDCQGVCDANHKVFGYENLYACDGSSIPDSGYANTGITITALALRLADKLIQQKG